MTESIYAMAARIEKQSRTVRTTRPSTVDPTAKLSGLLDLETTNFNSTSSSAAYTPARQTSLRPTARPRAATAQPSSRGWSAGAWPERKPSSPRSPRRTQPTLPAFAELQLRMPQQPQPELRASEALRVVAPPQWGAPTHRVHSVEVRPQGRRKPTIPSPRAASGGGPGASPRASKSLADFGMLAAACHRAGRRRDEAIAHYCTGVLLDNQGLPARANVAYERMLQAALHCGDARARAVAHNHLGVNLHALGQFGGALESHKLHAEVADTAGKFVAFVNVGLAHAELGEHADAAEAHQQALRLAIRTSSQQGESLACANLALAGRGVGDLEMARSCMERRVQLAAALKDTKAEAEGLKALGRLAVEAGDLEQAGAHFEQAVSAAEADELALNEAKVELGVNNGQVGFEEWMAAHFAEGQGEPTATPRVATFGF